MTFKKCRNEGCEVLIEVRQTSEGWRPFEESGNMHQCQHSDYAKKQRAFQQEQKNNHGNEDAGGGGGYSIPTPTKEQVKEVTKDYLDHTQQAKEEWKHKTITDPTPEGFDLKINNFGKEHQIRASQFQIAGALYTISIWYE